MSSIPSQYSNRNDLGDQYRTQKAERDELAESHEREMDNLKKSYATEKSNLQDRFEQSVQTDKLAHYDHLRNQKKEITKEEKGLEENRRTLIGNKESQLRQDTLKLEQEGQHQLTTLQEKNAMAEAQERKRGIGAEEMVRTQNQFSAKSILDQSNKMINDLRENRETALSTAKDLHGQALDEMHTHYEELRNNVGTQYQAELKSTQATAAKQLNDKKLTNALWIEQYSNRQNDPFYNLQRFDSELTETDESYRLRVKVPEYERNQFRVQVAGQEVQLIGVRSNNEKAEVEPGRWISTASHQNVSERFALDHPVDSKQIMMTTDGDWLEYTLPKFGRNHTIREANDARKIAREQAEITHDIDFPSSLPKPSIPLDRSGKGTIGT